eukprot:gene18763-19069_t
MINQTTAGIYSWLPLGLKVLQNIERIVAEEQDRIGCHRVLMPTLQPASLWQESGRYDDYGKEMLRIKDRHDRDMLYGPTNEEVITDIMRQYLKSYRQLPQTLYQIGWKFRDEIRPRFGVMRGREFLMKDGYSFDLDYEGAKETYKKIFESYLVIFRRMGLTAIPVRADSGAIGGPDGEPVVPEMGSYGIGVSRLVGAIIEASIALGVAILIIVMAVMNGFRQELLTRIIGMRGHILVHGIEAPIANYQPVIDLVRKVPGVEKLAPQLAYVVQQTLGNHVQVLDWQHGDSQIFHAVQVERNVMFLILTLIILIASFNIISSLIMLVKDKTKDIAILRTMGASRGSMMRVFFLTGATIGAVGTLMGGLSGTELFSEEIYFLTQLPAKVDWWEVCAVVGMSLLLSFFATLYPAWRAARLDPVEALRMVEKYTQNLRRAELKHALDVAADDQVIASLPLPVGGLLSLESVEYLTQHLAALKEAQEIIGTPLRWPFLQMAFLALPVLSSPKIIDQGLIDVTMKQKLTLEAA